MNATEALSAALARDPLFLPACPHCSLRDQLARPHFWYGKNAARWALVFGCLKTCPVSEGAEWVCMTEKPIGISDAMPAFSKEEHEAAQSKLADWWRTRVRSYGFPRWDESRKDAWLKSEGGRWLHQ